MNEAGVAPPGTMPMKTPTIEERIDVSQYFGSSFQVSSTTFMFSLALAPLNARPSSSVSRISPMPNKPITAIRKSNPGQQALRTESKTQRAGHRVSTDGSQREAEHHRRERP